MGFHALYHKEYEIAIQLVMLGAEMSNIPDLFSSTVELDEGFPKEFPKKLKQLAKQAFACLVTTKSNMKKLGFPDSIIVLVCAFTMDEKNIRLAKGGCFCA